MFAAYVHRKRNLLFGLVHLPKPMVLQNLRGDLVVGHDAREETPERDLLLLRIGDDDRARGRTQARVDAKGGGNRYSPAFRGAASGAATDRRLRTSQRCTTVPLVRTKRAGLRTGSQYPISILPRGEIRGLSVHLAQGRHAIRRGACQGAVGADHPRLLRELAPGYRGRLCVFARSAGSNSGILDRSFKHVPDEGLWQCFADAFAGGHAALGERPAQNSR